MARDKFGFGRIHLVVRLMYFSLVCVFFEEGWVFPHDGGGFLGGGGGGGFGDVNLLSLFKVCEGGRV